MSVTQQELLEALIYNPEDGSFTWRVTRSNRALAGTKTGLSKDLGGYPLVRINKVLYRAHRLAYLYMTGAHPPADIDHINGDRADNRWTNLRAAERWQNCSNKKIPLQNKSGVKGVCWDNTNSRWLATIRFAGRQKYLGLFLDKGCAERAVREAREKYHGEFARHD